MYFKRSFALAAGLQGLANASPAVSKQNAPSGQTQSFLINYNICSIPEFETYPSTVGSVPGVGNANSATIIGDYDLLNFNTLLVNQTQPFLAGVACHTEPACFVVTASASLEASLVGLTSGQSGSALGPGVVTAAYQYSPISYFQPYVFYYGCVAASGNGAASVPVSCTVTATGYNSKGQKVTSQQFNYKPNGAVVAQMTEGFFNQGWTGLQVRTLEYTVSNNLTTAVLIDNMVATVYGPQNAAITVDF